MKKKIKKKTKSKCTNIMRLQDFNILYINLDHRKDRLKWIQNELNRLNLLHRQNKITKRISGVNGQELHNISYVQKLAKEFGVPVEKMIADYWLSRKNFKTMCKAKTKILGKVGCTLGHLRAIKYVQEHNLFNIELMGIAFAVRGSSTARSDDKSHGRNSALDRACWQTDPPS